jgi:hypothetical protein
MYCLDIIKVNSKFDLDAIKYCILGLQKNKILIDDVFKII